MRVSRACCALAVIAGCGRLHFGDLTDGSGGDGAPISLVLPDGGEMVRLSFTPAGHWYAASVQGRAFRSDDLGMTWSSCGSLYGIRDLVTDTSGNVYVSAGTDVGASRDLCATWQPTGLGQVANALAATGTTIYAAVDTGVRVYNGTTWSVVTTPLDGNPFVAIAATGQDVLAGPYNSGLLSSQSAGTTWTQVTTGLRTQNVGRFARGQTHQFVMTLADSTSSGGVSCATNSVTWSVCDPFGGLAIAVQPGNDQFVVVAEYDDLDDTTDLFTTLHHGLREPYMDSARVNDLAFAGAGTIVAATDRGVFVADSSTLQWQPRTTGLQAWTIQAIVRSGTDVYLASTAGVLHSAGGAPFTWSTTGATQHTRTNAVAVAPDGTVIAPGRHIRASSDRGATWNEVDKLDATDLYLGTAIAFVGSRAFVGTLTRVLVADPPYTTWTPSTIAGANRTVHALLVKGTRVWAATVTGLYYSDDSAGTWTAVQIPGGTVCKALALLSDGSLAIGTDAGVVLSDPTQATFSAAGLPTIDINSIAELGGALVIGADYGAAVSHDRGATWTQIAAIPSQPVRGLALDPATGNLVAGVQSLGLVSAALP